MFFHWSFRKAQVSLKSRSLNAESEIISPTATLRYMAAAIIAVDERSVAIMDISGTCL